MMSLSEAAKSIAHNKCTVWRAIKAGRLSATKTEAGKFQIDPAELNRAFSKALFDAQIVKLKEMAKLLHDELTEARNHRDAWRSSIASPIYRPSFFLVDTANQAENCRDACADGTLSDISAFNDLSKRGFRGV
jgi:hypothetical protein